MGGLGQSALAVQLQLQVSSSAATEAGYTLAHACMQPLQTTLAWFWDSGSHMQHKGLAGSSLFLCWHGDRCFLCAGVLACQLLCVCVDRYALVSYDHGELVVEKEELLTRTLELHEGLGHGDVVEVLDTWCDASYPGSILASKAFTQVGLHKAGSLTKQRVIEQ